MSLEPLPVDAPAVLTYYPHCEPSVSKVVSAILHEMESAAFELYPTWLPAAAEIGGPGGLGIAAVRAIANELAATSPHFGPFISNLAERALRRGMPGGQRFSAEVRAAGLTRIISDSYGRRSLAILVHVPEGLSAAAERALLSACDWLVQHGVATIWLTGLLKATDRVRTLTVSLAEYPPLPIEDQVPEELNGPIGPAFSFPAVAGRPHPGSPAERRLEAALSTRVWASGRVWNQNYQAHALVNPVRLDLWWRDEHFVVEVDGPEHRGKWKFAEDRRRDVMLQTQGFAVLRFTNAQVLEDLDAVLCQIEEFIRTRRRAKLELSQHV